MLHLWAQNNTTEGAGCMWQSPGAASVLGEFKEMGLVGWLLVDAVLNLGGWAVAATLKVGSGYAWRLSLCSRITYSITYQATPSSCLHAD
jgi:hypothetical protein